MESVSYRNMPASTIPPELKKVAPFIRRAEELDNDQSSPESRLVAYYSRQYAVHQGIPLASSSPAANSCLTELLELLESEKPKMDNFTREEASFLCRKFANRVFDKADGEDRLGMAGKNTAKTFYAAASFLQILEQFNDASTTEGNEEEAEDRKRIIYAKWKATEILKALKEGRAPAPGGYGEEEPLVEDDHDDVEIKDASPAGPVAPAAPLTVPLPPPLAAPAVETVNAETDDDDDDNVYMPPPVAPAAKPGPPVNDTRGGPTFPAPPPPSYPGPPTAPPPDNLRPTGPPLPPPVKFDLPPAAPPAAAPSNNGGGNTGFLGGLFKSNSNGSAARASKAQLADATELTRFALAALEDRDGALAAERLAQALQALNGR